MEPDQNNQKPKDTPGLLKGLLARAEEYGRTSVELYKLKALGVGSDFLSLWIPRLVIGVFLLLFLFMLTIGVAFWVGDLLGRPSYGFFVVAGFYGLLGLILILFAGPIKRRLNNLIIKEALK
jgi:hypothetical protein